MANSKDDERVISLSIDYDKFAKDIKNVEALLSDLEKSLDFSKANNKLKDISNKGTRDSFNNIANNANRASKSINSSAESATKSVESFGDSVKTASDKTSAGAKSISDKIHQTQSDIDKYSAENISNENSKAVDSSKNLFSRISDYIKQNGESIKSHFGIIGAGISSIQGKINSINFDSPAYKLSSLQSQFSAFEIARTTAIAKLTSMGMDKVSAAIGEITRAAKDGFAEYELQMNSVQTILANTASKGTTIDEVNSALNELNTYADKTIYNFSEMTHNIGTFTAAGVDLKTSVDSIRGISNLAAVSGSSAVQASTAMYQLSQAIATGTVKLADWNSVVNAGMGGEVFQNALIRTSEHLKTGAKAAIAADGSFRESLKEGWLTTEVLTETLKQLQLNVDTQEQYNAAVADLVNQGYTEEEAKSIADLAKSATDAATKVKTFTQLVGTFKESIGSGWTETWENVFGSFNEAEAGWTSVSNALGNIVSEVSDARNSIFKSFHDNGGTQELYSMLTDMVKVVGERIQAIRDAFASVFDPNVTGKHLVDFVKSIHAVVNAFDIAGSRATILTSIVKIFALALKAIGTILYGISKVIKFVATIAGNVLSKVSDGIVKIAKVIKRLSDLMKSGAKATLSWLDARKQSIASWAQSRKEMIENSDGVIAFQESLSKLKDSFVKLGNAIRYLFDKSGAPANASALYTAASEDTRKSIDKLNSAVDKVKESFHRLADSIKDAATKFKDAFDQFNVGKKIFDASNSGVKHSADAVSWLADRISDLADWIVKFADGTAEFNTKVTDSITKFVDKAAASIGSFADSVSKSPVVRNIKADLSGISASVAIFAKNVKDDVSALLSGIIDGIKESNIPGRTIKILDEIKSGVSDFSQKVLEKIQIVLDSINKAFGNFVSTHGDAVGNAASSISGKVGTASNQISGYVQNGSKSAADSVKNNSGIINSAIESTHPAFVGFKNDIDSAIGPSAVDAFNRLGNAISAMSSYAGDSLSHAGESLSSWFIRLEKYVIGALGQILDFIKSRFGGIANIFKKLGNVIGKVIGGIGDAIKNLVTGTDFEDILSLINSGAIVALIIRFKKHAKDVKKITNSLTALPDSLSKILNSVSGVINNFADSIKVNKLLIEAVAIGILTYSLYKLGQLDFSQIVSGMTGIATVIGILLGSMKGLIKISSELQEMDAGSNGATSNALKSVIKDLILISIAFDIMSSGMKKLKGVDTDTVIIALAGYAAIIVAIGYLIKSINSSGTNGNSNKVLSVSAGNIAAIAVLLIAAATAFVTVASAIAILAAIQPDRLSKICGGLATAFIVLGITLTLLMNAIANKNNAKAKAAEGKAKELLAISAVLISFGIALQKLAIVVFAFSKMDPDKLKQGFLATIGLLSIIVAVIAAFVKVCQRASADSSAAVKGAIAVVIIAVAMQMIVPALMLLTLANPGKLWSSVSAMLLLIGGFIAGVALIANQMSKMESAKQMIATLGGIALALVAFGLTIQMLVPAFAILTALNTGKLWSSILAVVACLGAFVAIPILLNKYGGGFESSAKGLVLMSAALLIFSKAIKTLAVAGLIFSKVSFGGFLELIGTIVVVGAVFVAVVKALQGTEITLIAVGTSLTEIGLGMALFGVGLTLAAVGLTAIGAMLPVMVDEIMKAIDVAIRELPQLVHTLLWAIKQILDDLQDQLPGILDSLDGDIMIILKHFGEDAPKYATYMVETVLKVLQAVDSHIDEIVNYALDIVISVLDGLANRMPEISKALDRVFTGIFDAVTEKLSNTDPDVFIKIIVSIEAMALIIKQLAKLKKDVKDALPALAMIVGTFALMGIVLGIIANDGGSGAGAQAALFSIAAAVAAMVGVIYLASQISISSVENAVPTLVLCIAVFAVMGLLFKMISDLDGANALLQAAAISLVLGAITGVIAVLGNMPISAGLTAAANLAEFIGGLTAIVVACGALNQIPGIEWLMSEGAQFLQTLGSAIGGFLGGLVGGALEGGMEGAANGITALGNALSSFFNSIANVNWDTMSAAVGVIGGLTGALAGMMAENMLANNPIAKLIFGDDPSGVTNFTNNLSNLGTGMNNFANELSGVNLDVMNQATSATVSLMNAFTDLPNVGGLQSWFSGDAEWGPFTSGLESLGNGMKSYGQAVEGLDTDAITASIPGVQGLADVYSALPNIGGMMQIFTGTADWTGFTNGLDGLGNGMKSYGLAVAGLDNDAINASIPGAKALEEVYSALPNMGGMMQVFTGEKDWSGFTNGLDGLGNGLASYGRSVAGIDNVAVRDSVDSVKALEDIYNALPDTGGLIQKFTGDDKNWDDFGYAMMSFGQAIYLYNNKVKGINSSKVKDSIGAIESIASLESGTMSSILNIDVSNFGTSMTNLGTSLSQYAANLINYDGYTVSQSVNMLYNISGLLKEISSSDYSGVSAFLTAISDIGTTDFGAAVNSLNTYDSSIKDSLTNIGTSITDGSNALASAISTFNENLSDKKLDLDSLANDSSDIRTRVANTLSGITETINDSGNTINNGFNSIVSSISNFSDPFYNTSYSSFLKINDAVDSVFSEVTSNISGNKIPDIIRTLRNSKNDLYNAGVDTGMKIKDGFGTAFDNISTMYTKEKSVAIVSALNNSKSDMASAGANLAQGFIDGLNNKSDEVSDAAYRIGSAAVDAMKRGTDEHSPSKATYKIGEFFIKGFTNALDDENEDTVNRVAKFGTDAISAFNNAVKDANELDNYAPKISPVLDLSTAKNQMASMFNSSSGTIRANLNMNYPNRYYVDPFINKMNGYQTAIMRSNSDVTTAIDGLRSDMAQYSDAISSHETAMYVDGKKLASTIAKPMNQQLGVLSRRSVYR